MSQYVASSSFDFSNTVLPEFFLLIFCSVFYVVRHSLPALIFVLFSVPFRKASYMLHTIFFLWYQSLFCSYIFISYTLISMYFYSHNNHSHDYALHNTTLSSAPLLKLLFPHHFIPYNYTLLLSTPLHTLSVVSHHLSYWNIHLFSRYNRLPK